MPKLLIVDDEEMMREVVGDFLIADGLAVPADLLFAHSGVEGLAQYEKHRPAIVISDMMMPEMDGGEMIRRIRELGDPVEIVVITGFADTDIVQSVAEQKIAAMLKKPFDRLELKACIGEILERISAGRNK
jgi:two-component system, response regulator YesN